MSTPKSRWLTVLDWVTVVFMAMATALVFLYAPTEKSMGDVQRVFYFHVAVGWTGMLGFLCALVAGMIYLRTHHRTWDIVGLAEIGRAHV